MSSDVAAVLPENSGSLVSGTSKLVQRFILELLTIKGSLLFAPDRGTTLVSELQSRRFSSEFDVLQSFAAALLTLKKNLTGEELTTDPAGERYGGAKITKLILVPGALVLTIAVRSKAEVDTTVSTALEIL